MSVTVQPLVYKVPILPHLSSVLKILKNSFLKSDGIILQVNEF